MRSAALVAIASLWLAAAAGAHGPQTAIGRAVEAFGSVPVSWDPGSVVSEVEAGGFPAIAGSNPKVAFLPAAASEELGGGTDAIADEIAREAGLDGTLGVLAGGELGAWSEDVSGEPASRARQSGACRRPERLPGRTRRVARPCDPAGAEAALRAVGLARAGARRPRGS